MIWNPIAILTAIFGGGRTGAGHLIPNRPAADVAERWERAVRRDPELVHDLIRLGGLLDMPPVTMADGMPEPSDRNPYQCGRADGRRELALTLLAAGQIDIHTLNQLMEDEQ